MLYLIQYCYIQGRIIFYRFFTATRIPFFEVNTISKAKTRSCLGVAGKNSKLRSNFDNVAFASTKANF